MDPETVSVENPYGLGALWAQGDFVAKGTLILLALMSAYSWFIIFTKWWEQRRLLRQAREVEKAFWQAENIKAGVTPSSPGRATSSRASPPRRSTPPSTMTSGLRSRCPCTSGSTT